MPIETHLPQIETDMPKIETALPKIETASLWPSIYFVRITLLRQWYIKAEPSQFCATKWLNIFPTSWKYFSNLLQIEIVMNLELTQGGIDLWQVGQLIKREVSICGRSDSRPGPRTKIYAIIIDISEKKIKWPDPLTETFGKNDVNTIISKEVVFTAGFKTTFKIKKLR